MGCVETSVSLVAEFPGSEVWSEMLIHLKSFFPVRVYLFMKHVDDKIYCLNPFQRIIR